MKLFVSIIISILFSVILNAQQNGNGVTTVGNTAVSETVGDIMTRQILNDTPRSVEMEKEKEYPSRENLPQNSNSQSVSSYSSDLKVRNIPNQVTSSAPIIKGLSFTGGTLAGGGAFPPDNMGSVGPNQYIVAINSIITSYNKTTGVADGALNVSTDVFFQSVVTSGGYTSDPHIRYDRLSKRWIFIIIDVPASSTVANRILVGVSQDSIITFSTVIKFFYYQNSGNFIDYPTLGIDKNALYIGGNLFNYAGTSFLGTIGLVVQKSSIMGSGPMVATKFSLGTGSTGLYTPQGVDNLYDLTAAEGYFIGVDNALEGQLDLIRVTNPGTTTPTISSAITITVPTTYTSGTLFSKSCTYSLDSDDERLLAAMIRNGHLWTAHHIQTTNAGVGSSGGTRISARWYDLINYKTGSTPSANQSGTVYSSALTTTRDKNYAYPTITVNGQGHSLMGFTATGYYSYANAGFTYRLNTDPLGTMTAPDSTTASTTSYNPTGDGASASVTHRWGDYSMTECDPSDDMTFWTIQQFCDATNDYGCRVTQFKAPAPATLTLANPNILGPGSHLSLVIKGDTTTGLGFYEPGSGFSKHLSASIDGGIVVDSLKYNGPGTITLYVTTTAGTSGARTVTITNPDGQVVSSGSIFTYQGVAGPNLAAAPSALSGFSYIVGSGPTVSQPYNLSGTNLTGYPGSITVTAPANYEVSLNDINFSASQLVSYTSATLSSTTIHIRLKSGLSTGSYSGNVTNSGGGASDLTVACSGAVNPVPTATLTVAPGTLSGFSYSTGAGPSTSQFYNLSGTNLTPTTGSITVQCLTNYEVSTNNSTFSSSVSPTYTGGTLSATPIYIRLKAGLTSGSYNSETVSNTGGGASAQNVTCSGSVNDVTTLFTDDFNYTVGTILTANGWAAHNGAGNNPPAITIPGLTYSNYGGSGVGNAVTLSGNGEDDNHSFTSISSGSVYASAMVNITSASASGDYFLHFSVGTTTTYNARVFVKSATGGFVFGISKSGTNIQWSSTVLSTGTTNFIVLKYTFVSGATNDKAELFINPAVGGSEPASDLSAIITVADFSAIDRICLRQSSTTPVAVIDGIRIGQTWASVTPATVTTKTLTLTALIEGLFNGTSMIPDTVTIDLHSTISPYTLVESQRGVLNSAGVGIFTFAIAADGTPYYLVFKHRNAVETWSATGNSFTSSLLSYNFTTGATQAFGNNMRLKSGQYCIYSGDCSHDGSVNLTDMILVDNDNSSLRSGYLDTDMNGDGHIDLSDLIIVDNNNSALVSKSIPPVVPFAIQVNKPLKINRNEK